MDSRIKRQNAELECKDIKYIASSENSEDISYSMTVNDRFVRVTCAHTSCTNTLTLPSVSEAAGLIFDIRAPDTDTSLTIEDKDGDAGLSNIVLGDDADYVILMSNGYEWTQLAGETD
jgi:hypothetical protein